MSIPNLTKYGNNEGGQFAGGNDLNLHPFELELISLA